MASVRANKYFTRLEAIREKIDVKTSNEINKFSLDCFDQQINNKFPKKTLDAKHKFSVFSIMNKVIDSNQVADKDFFTDIYGQWYSFDDANKEKEFLPNFHAWLIHAKHQFEELNLENIFSEFEKENKSLNF